MYQQRNQPNFKIIILGLRGTGKTTFLSSMYYKFSTPNEKLSLECVETGVDGVRNLKKELDNMHDQIINPSQDWLPGTIKIQKWPFNLQVHISLSDVLSACRFTYIDFAGGVLQENNNRELDGEIKKADNLLLLLDGEQLLFWINEEKNLSQSAVSNITKSLNIIIEKLIRHKEPVHIIISKWDLLHNNDISLKQVKDSLLKIDPFRNLVKHRIENNSPIRLIPVSAVGMKFARLEEGRMIKTGEYLKPVNVEIPLAYVITDKLVKEIKGLEEVEKEVKEKLNNNNNNNNNNNFQQVSLWGTILQATKRLLPYIAYNLPVNLQIFATKEFFTDISDLGSKLKGWSKDEIKKQMESRLKMVTNEKSALQYAVNQFQTLQSNFEKDPAFCESVFTECDLN